MHSVKSNDPHQTAHLPWRSEAARMNVSPNSRNGTVNYITAIRHNKVAGRRSTKRSKSSRELEKTHITLEDNKEDKEQGREVPKFQDVKFSNINSEHYHGFLDRIFVTLKKQQDASHDSLEKNRGECIPAEEVSADSGMGKELFHSYLQSFAAEIARMDHMTKHVRYLLKM